ncbi:hypothetical protein MBH78_17580 [Oceanimonas sp. NS1]|nr:hypothetical protein [Oceanimonas sp. NS1]
MSRGTIDTDGDGSRLGEGFTGLLGPAPGTIDWTGQSYTNGGYVYDPTVANIGGSGLDLTVTSEEGGGGTEEFRWTSAREMTGTMMEARLPWRRANPEAIDRFCR